MDNDLYSNIGYIVVLGMKYIFIPIGVGVSITVIAHKLLRPHPDRQKKRRSK